MENVKSITIWYNDQKGNPNWPYFTGKVTYLDGTVENVQLWTKVSQRGETYYNGQIKPFQPKQDQPQPVKPQPEPVNFSVPASGKYNKDQEDAAKAESTLKSAKTLLKIQAQDFIKRFEETPVNMLRPEDYEKYNLEKKRIQSGYYEGQNQEQSGNFEFPPF